MKFKLMKKSTVISIAVISLLTLLIAEPVLADGFWVHTVLGSLASGIVSALGWVLTQLIKVLVYLAGYNQFIKSAAVSNGWVIARDIANMFFVVILLIIAFATILQIEQYNYKKWLPKLILMAILINFSKTICGLLIDVAQVVMLTFVNAFIGLTAGNLTDMLGIRNWQKIQENGAASGQAVSGWEAAATYILAVIYVIIAVIVVAAMVGMLVMRIIMIWVYVVLSPFAYLLAAFPGGQKYSSQWWSEFTKNLIVGPVLAFFIWLSFASLVDLSKNDDFSGIQDFTDANKNSQICQKDSGGQCVFGTSELMLKFIISIAMLLGGMKIAQEIGGAAGGVAGSIASKGKGLALVGAGAVGGVLGYNFAKRRINAWRQETKKNVQQKSDLFYEGAKGKVKGAVRATTLGAYEDTGLKNLVENNALSNKIKSKKVENKERRREGQAIYEAFNSGEYRDASGKVYNYDSASNKYKDASGAFAKNSKGTDIEKISDSEAVFQSRINDSMTKAKALKNQINDEKMSSEQKLFEGAGSSVGDLKRVLNDSSENRDKRMAAALQLAAKEGFKNSNLTVGRQEVSTAKSIIGDNAPMLKKFEDQINKRFAALNYDVSTTSGADAYKEAMADGSVNGYRQDASTYDENIIRTLKSYSGKDFSKNISSTMSESQAHRSNIESALGSARNTDIDSGKALFDSATGEINEFAKIIARNGDIIKAFNNTTTGGAVNFDSTSQDALIKFLETAKSEHVSNINGDIFDPAKLDKILAKDNISTTSSQRNSVITNVNIAIARGMEVNKLATMERADQNPEGVRRIIGAIDKYGTATQRSEIASNNILKNIKFIPAI